VFAVAGELSDPASRRADVTGQAAAQVPVEDSLRKLSDLQVSASTLAQAEHVQDQQKAMGMKV
jgi:hypothetical protein